MKKSFIAVLAAMAVAATVQTASAAPTGTLFTDGAGQPVRVTATSIDWYPLGGGDGTLVSGVTTGVDYVDSASVAQTLGGAVTPGVIKDLGPVPVADFMTFAGHPDLHFDLSALGPGDPTNCQVGLGFVTSGSCSFTAFGSPFILTYLSADRTGVLLGASGVARDAEGNSLWTGGFTTQVNKSIGTIFNDIYGPNGVGYVESTHSGEFVMELVPVPEPASMLLLGLGLSAAAVGLRRRR